MRAFGSVLVFLAACQTVPSRNEKPQAAVDVRVAERDLGGGAHEVTLTATPTRDVVGLALDLDGRRVDVGAARAGEAHTVTVRASGTRDVIGTAWVGHRSKSAHVHLGPVSAPAAARPTTIVTMPDGSQVEEARP